MGGVRQDLREGRSASLNLSNEFDLCMTTYKLDSHLSGNLIDQPTILLNPNRLANNHILIVSTLWIKYTPSFPKFKTSNPLTAILQAVQLISNHPSPIPTPPTPVLPVSSGLSGDTGAIWTGVRLCCGCEGKWRTVQDGGGQGRGSAALNWTGPVLGD